MGRLSQLGNALPLLAEWSLLGQSNLPSTVARLPFLYVTHSASPSEVSL